MALLNRTLCKCIVICLIIQCIFYTGHASELSRHRRAKTFDVASATKENSQSHSGTTTEKTFHIIKAGRNCPSGTAPDHNDDCREESFFSAVSPNKKPKATGSKNDKTNVNKRQ